MSEIGVDMAVEMVRAASRRLAEAAHELSRLDGIAGDGDHGLNVATAFANAESSVAKGAPASAADVFMSVSRAFNNGGAGASSALFGALFGALAGRLAAVATPGLADLVDGLELGLRRVQEVGHAEAGDKTMVDALRPSVDAARSALAQGATMAEVLSAVAAAAQSGANATADMHARAGRARYTAGGGVGTRDPGALTIAVIFRAWDAAATWRPATTGDRASKLTNIATDSGQFAILALDHIRSFATTMRPEDPDSMTPAEIKDSKALLIRNLGGLVSAILIDPALAPLVRETSSGSGTGLIIGIEDGDYEAAASHPRLLPGWTVERAAQAGADAAKISFTFDPDDDTSAAERFVSDTVLQCERAGLPLLCEPLAPVGAGRDARQTVLEGVKRFGGLGASVLKIQFPGDTTREASRDAWMEACHDVDALSAAPWVLLSEGRRFEEFRELLAVACRAGASGFVAGRAIWGGVEAGQDGIAAPTMRLKELRSIATVEASPFGRRISGPRP